jgi:hypothetical protein
MHTQSFTISSLKSDNLFPTLLNPDTGGQVAEWLKASVLKADIPLGIVGSNPTLSY